MNRSDHFVIVGSTPIAENTYREMKRRDQLVTVIVKEPPSGRFDADDVVVGDANDVEVLRRANVDRARAVMVMRPDDFESAFVVLAVKELKGPAKTYLILNDRKHLERVKLVHPNVIMTPDVLGGELLAMALTGQDITGQYVLGRLFEYTEPTDAGS